MEPTWIVLPAALVGGFAVWLGRRRVVARRAACRRRFAAVLAESRPGSSVVEESSARWRLEEPGRNPVPVDGKALTRAAEGDARRLFLAVADAATLAPRPLAGEFDLKRHGPRTLPRLAGEGLPLLALEPRAVRFTAAASAGLETIYVVDGEKRPACLTEEHLDRAGIDARDVHGVALAVLRQRFDAAAVRAVLSSGEAAVLEPADGCGGSRLLLLPEALGTGERLFAAAPSPAVLLIGARRAALERARDRLGDTPEPLPAAVFRVTGAGLTRES